MKCTVRPAGLELTMASYSDVALAHGGAVLVYRAVDGLPPNETRLFAMRSEDAGRTWHGPHPVDIALSRSADQALWNRPRLSAQHDGGLTLLADVRLFGKGTAAAVVSPERTRVLLWRSFDGGLRWSEARFTAIQGRMPDRLHEFSADTWLVATDYESMRHFGACAQVVNLSTDGGENWGTLSVVADLPGMCFRAGCIAAAGGGRLACLLGEESGARVPLHVSFSFDGGMHWSLPGPMPLVGVRPVVGWLRSGWLLCLYYERPSLKASEGCVAANVVAWLGRQLTDMAQGYTVTVAQAKLDFCHQGSCGFVELGEGNVLIAYDDTTASGHPCVRSAFLEIRC